eukprot:CAMPEP_0184481212 /NCGR_PEP_ID=MMETSP0113_2-20130426/2751_1 /TAXON_ID=91329 /ORGANISM="Norrisiella sphaerica, Strain BC52" /LENGTH=308 /DNA_ID=CAMNT_0026860187 /DNA_START=29 /DNA_END=955 /DNA_ORIENTATION=-
MRLSLFLPLTLLSLAHGATLTRPATTQRPAFGIRRESRMLSALSPRVRRAVQLRAAVATNAEARGSTSQTEPLSRSLALAAATTVGPLMAAHGALAASDALGPSGEIPKAAYPALGLFVLAFPGVWSQIKRAPKANVKRATFEVAGPSAPNGVETDTIAKKLFGYMLKYNYAVKDRGQVITFAGKYASDKGQAAFITAFTFLSMLSLGLVLSTIFPDKGGNAWYLLALLSPAAGNFVLKNGEREELFRIKMATTEDGMRTDIFVEGDIEEIERMQNELGLKQKGKVKVKGVFEEGADSSSLPAPPQSE